MSKNRVHFLGLIISFVVACGGESVPMRITDPSPGEALIAGTVQAIEWEAASGVSEVDIWLTVPGGTVVAIARDADNSGRYEWDVPILPVSLSAMSVLHVASDGSMPDGAKPLGSSNILSEDNDDGTPVSVGSLAGFRWNESTGQEEYYWIDTTDASSEVKGIVGDLTVWHGEVIVDVDEHRVYVLGIGGATLEEVMAGGGVEKIYTLDAHSGELLDSRLSDLGYVTVSTELFEGHIMGFRWNETDTVEEMLRIDPVTGDTTFLGTVGDLMWWSGEAIINPDTGVVYVIGMTGMEGPEKIYSLDLRTGELLHETLLVTSEAYHRPVALTVTSAGDLIGFRWHIELAVEQIVTVDPTTGDVAPFGTVGDLKWWHTVAPLNRTNDECYVFGINGDPGVGETRMYVMDTVRLYSRAPPPDASQRANVRGIRSLHRRAQSSSKRETDGATPLSPIRCRGRRFLHS